jgi:histidyl-tRNA synthetase
VKFSPSLVRGLAYYDGIVLEIVSEKLSVSLGGGGSYRIDGKEATGISLGLEPIMILENLKINQEKFLVVSLEQDEEAIKIVRILRKQGKNASIFYGKPSKALEFANSYNYGNVIFVGEKEVQAKRYKVKDMVSGKVKGIKI